MKKILVLITAVISISGISQGQLTIIQYPSPEEYCYAAGTEFITETEGFLVMVWDDGIPTPGGGCYAQYYLTYDGGQNWEFLSQSSFEAKNGSIRFIEDNEEGEYYFGYIAGDYSVVGSYNTVSGSFNGYLSTPSAYLIDGGIGMDGSYYYIIRYWAKGIRYGLWKVMDNRGSEELFSSTDSLLLQEPFFTSSSEGFIRFNLSETGPDGILHTIDSGATFDILYTNDSLTFTNMVFRNDEEGYVTTLQGYLLKTIDGGNNWETLPLLPGTGLYSITFLDNLTGYCGGNNGTIFKTIDEGVTWQQQIMPELINIRKIMMSGESKGFLQAEFYTYLLDVSSGITESSNHYGIFPNPATDKITVRSGLFPGESDIEVELFDLTGEKVEKTLNLPASDQSAVDVSDLPSGFYLIRLTTGDKLLYSGKVLILR